MTALQWLSALVAVTAVAAVVFFDNLGYWELFTLLGVASLSAFASVPGVPRLVKTWVTTWREGSPARMGHLQRRPSRLVYYGLWFACLFAFLEVTYWALGRYVVGNKVVNVQFLWQLPMGYGVIFGFVGGVVYLISRWRSTPLVSLLVFMCGLVGFSGLMFLVPGVHRVAALILAAGVAFQMARFVGAHILALELLIRRTRILLLLVPAVAVGSRVWPIWAEHRALSALSAPSGPVSNVMLIVLDTVGAARMSLYGHSRLTTPNQDRIAQRGTVFARAYATAPWTLPSHGSMFTGRFPHEMTGTWFLPIDGSHPTIAEALRSRGYQTAGFVANLQYCSEQFGLARGFLRYEDAFTSLSTALLRTSPVTALNERFKLTSRSRALDGAVRKDAGEVSRDVLAWLDRRQTAQPFFVFVNYFDAHAPYYPPEVFARRFAPSLPMGDLASKRLDAWSPAEVGQLAAAHDGAIAYLDHELGLLLEALEQRGVLANTTVIVTADHGEQFGEHGLLEHSSSLYSALLRVPLFILSPSVPAGLQVEVPVSLRDLPATIMELVGFGNGHPFPGDSLATLWQSASVPPQRERVVLAEVERVHSYYPDSYPARKGPMKAIVSDGRLYIRHGDGREELYDVAADPAETYDLVRIQPELLLQYRVRMEEILAETSGTTPQHR